MFYNSSCFLNSVFCDQTQLRTGENGSPLPSPHKCSTPHLRYWVLNQVLKTPSPLLSGLELTNTQHLHSLQKTRRPWLARGGSGCPERQAGAGAAPAWAGPHPTSARARGASP